MIVVAQTPSTSKSPWTVIRLQAAIAAWTWATTASIDPKAEERVRLVGSQEGPCLLGRPVAAPDKRHRHRLAQIEAVGDGPHIRVGVGLGGERFQGLRHTAKLGRRSDRFPAAWPAETAGEKRYSSDSSPRTPIA